MNKINVVGNTVYFYEIRDTASRYFKEAIAIYENSFPANERSSVDTIKERMERGRYRVIVGTLGDKVVSMAFLWLLEKVNFVLLDYMAVKRGYRDRGIGTKFVQNIYNILGTTDKHFIIEVENPNYGRNKKQREKRIRFYKKNGAKVLLNVRYVLPPLSGDAPTEMLLMIFPEYNSGEIAGETVKRVIIQIYKELYERSDDDTLLNSFIHNIPDTVKLGVN